MVTLISGNLTIPAVFYSFTYNKVYISEQFYTVSNESLPPILCEILLEKFVIILKWWKSYISKIENKEIIVDVIYL